MARPRGNRKEARLSVSLDARDYAQLGAMARKSDVSVAWLVRRAITEFVAREIQPGETSELPLQRPGADLLHDN